MAFLNKGDQVLIPNPGYPTYTSVSCLVEADPIYYSLSRVKLGARLTEIEQQDLSKVKIMGYYPHAAGAMIKRCLNH